MKHFYFIAIAICLSSIAFSAPVIKAVNTGTWDATTTWDKNRAPVAGDTVIINPGINVSVVKDVALNGVIYLKVYGGLSFNNYATVLSMAANSTIIVYQGGYITGNSASQKIKIGSNNIYSGDATVTGPQMIAGSEVAFSSMSVLPVRFTGFSVARKTTGILVQWATAQESNASFYAVERSLDGISWSVIATVAAVGNSNVVNNYSYTDVSIPSKTVYYRIKQVDVDGGFIYTPVRSLLTSTTDLTDINVAGIQNKVVLQFPQEVKGTTQVRFVSMNGQVMEQQVINGAVGQVILNANVKGAFVVVISNQDLLVAKQVLL